MSEHNFNMQGYGGDSSNYMYFNNSFGYYNQQQNNPFVFPTNLFNSPPPPLNTNYPIPLPPVLPVIPPGTQFETPVNNLNICPPFNYSNPSLNFGNQQYSSNFQPPFIIPNVLPSTSNQASAVPPVPTSNSDIISPLSTDIKNKNQFSPEEESKRPSIESWVKNRSTDMEKVEEIKQNDSKSPSSSPELKIFEVKGRVIEICKMLRELENLSISLSVIYKSLNDHEWRLRCLEIEEKKKLLTNLLHPLMNNKELILKIKKNLLKRQKKRKLQKIKREEWKHKKVENSIKRQHLHKKIDMWLEDMKDSVERGKLDEELKREADSVLADVTRKKAEAKKQLALLTTLLKLRDARIIAKKSVGQNISQQQTDAFNNVIERLKSLWTRQLNGYSLEEQGLKVMLNDAAAVEKNNEILRKKEVLREWEMVIFGKNKNNDYQPRNINEFILARKQWDQFVVREGTVMSSRIPPGWVIPVEAVNSNWEKFIKEHKN